MPSVQPNSHEKTIFINKLALALIIVINNKANKKQRNKFTEAQQQRHQGLLIRD